ncbi:MAG: mechanosensitive ion channel [Opitutaceae bacterium]|nr:mechanosensitive ion channel [Opitutaceae bacterium]
MQDRFAAHGLSPEVAHRVTVVIGILALVGLAWVANVVAKQVILRSVSILVKRTRFTWDDALLESGVFTRLSHLAPAMAINALGDDVLGAAPETLSALKTAVGIYLTLIWLAVFFAFLNALALIIQRKEKKSDLPLKGFFQAIKLVASAVALILVLSTILDQSPIYLLSGIGALTAVLLLVFKDAILGFVAGIMISVNDLVRLGDWIEMPKAGADGFVTDIALTTLKVQNWDKTITTIPSYDLISSSFKNWRGMFDSGGRRIKRALQIDLQSVRFADEALVERWTKIDLLSDYLREKRGEITRANEERGSDLSILGNGRRITNMGTFRAYCTAYLRAHPGIHQEMTFLIRQLAPTEHGLPLEIYVFTNDTRWAIHEAIQADIFDHLTAVIGELELRIYQQPSGRDVQLALAAEGAAG